MLNNRRRILRRGLPYGNSSEGTSDSDEHGVVMLVGCTSLFRQFEFVQQQWINYGLDANVGNDTCPLTGNHSGGADGPKAKFVIASDSKIRAAAVHPRGYSPIRRDPWRRIFLRTQYDGLAHDRNGSRRPHLNIGAAPKGSKCRF